MPSIRCKFCRESIDHVSIYGEAQRTVYQSGAHDMGDAFQLDVDADGDIIVDECFVEDACDLVDVYDIDYWEPDDCEGTEWSAGPYFRCPNCHAQEATLLELVELVEEDSNQPVPTANEGSGAGGDGEPMETLEQMRERLRRRGVQV